MWGWGHHVEQTLQIGLYAHLLSPSMYSILLLKSDNTLLNIFTAYSKEAEGGGSRDAVRGEEGEERETERARERERVRRRRG